MVDHCVTSSHWDVRVVEGQGCFTKKTSITVAYTTCSVNEVLFKLCL